MVNFTPELKRFHSKNKRKAIIWMNKLNKVVPAGKRWRIGIKITDKIIIDIDDLDLDNLLKINKFYSRLFMTPFKMYKTYAGYHLISTRTYINRTTWLYDVCRILKPELKPLGLNFYIDEIHKFYEIQYSTQQHDRKEKKQFIKEFTEDFIKSGLFSGYGNFDVLFIINAIMKERFILRITKKSKDDAPQQLSI